MEKFNFKNRVGSPVVGFPNVIVKHSRFFGGCMRAASSRGAPGYQVLSDILSRLGLIVNALTQCSA